MNKERFTINKVMLCTFDCADSKSIRINSENYPDRWCVIDNEKNIAVDIKMGLSYDFIPTFSGMYLASKTALLIEENKRAAIHACVTIDCDEDILEAGRGIISDLKNGYIYPDGNEMLNETEYFEDLELEKAQEQKNNLKVLKKRF